MFEIQFKIRDLRLYYWTVQLKTKNITFLKVQKMMILALEADMSGLVFQIVTNWQVIRLYLQKIIKNCSKTPKSQVSNSFCVKSRSGNNQIAKIPQNVHF